MLECTIEAYPNAVNYWERHDGKIIQNSEGKYALGTKEFEGYKASLTLKIRLTEPADFGAYYCISKNEKGLTKGGITLFGELLIIFLTFFLSLQYVIVSFFIYI